jgi:AcrR family transcriptional regulator
MGKPAKSPSARPGEAGRLAKSPKRKRGRPSNEVRATLAQHIAQSAWSAFVERGFSQTTVQDICDSADVSLATFYRYYSSKNDVLKLVMRRAGDAVLQQLRLAETATTLEESLLLFATNFTSSPAHLEFADALTLLVSEIKNFPELLQLVAQPSLEWLSGIQNLISREYPTFTTGETLDLAFLFADMVGARVFRERALAMRGPNPAHASKLVQTTVRIFVAGVAAVAAEHERARP